MRVVQALLILIATSLPALAADGFDIVIPGRANVPIIINGQDVSYTVLEGDWGFYRGNHPQPTAYGGRYIDPLPNVGHYFPSSGSSPGYGRQEIEPRADRKLPKPAESFHQSWSAQSGPPAPQQPAVVPFYPPPVIQAPQEGAQQGAREGGYGVPGEGAARQEFRRSNPRRPPN